MRKERGTVETRQGEPGRRILTVLVISVSTAFLLAILGYFYLLGTDNEETAEEPVEIITPADG